MTFLFFALNHLFVILTFVSAVGTQIKLSLDPGGVVDIEMLQNAQYLNSEVRYDFQWQTVLLHIFLQTSTSGE